MRLATSIMAACLATTTLVWADDPMKPNDPMKPDAPRNPDGSLKRDGMKHNDGVKYDNAKSDTQLMGLPTGVTAKELNDQEDIRSVLASATNAAFVKGGFDDLMERLTSADRKRIGSFSEQQFAELDGRIEQIRKNWQTKYGESLNLDNPKLFEGFVMIKEGEVTDAATAQKNWPVRVTGMSPREPANANTFETASYLENGRNVAVVVVPKGHGNPGIAVSMLHEQVDDWRIDIADNITGQQVYDNLKACLTKCGDNVAEWPADKNEAYRGMAHGVLVAIYNVPRDAGSADSR